VATGVIAIIFTALLYAFLYRTRPGKAIRAVSMNRTAAELMGINSSLILALSFGIGISLAMVAGALIATIFPFTILSGGGYELKSFVICVLGGLGSPIGALVGGITLGLIESVVTLGIQTSFVPVLEFALLVAILVVKPSGLLGGK
ncbi:branched-chain amino acid ABC transporter permease, partial [Archaeoglobales archaeon]